MCIRDSGDIELLQHLNTQTAGLGFPQLLDQGLGTGVFWTCLLYTSDAADERSSVDLGGRRIIKKKNIINIAGLSISTQTTLVNHKNNTAIKYKSNNRR